MTTPSVLFWGMQGPFSSESLLALVRAGFRIPAVVVPGDRDGSAWRHLAAATDREPAVDLPLATPYLDPDTVQIAHLHRIPVYAVGDVGAQHLSQRLLDLDADVCAVACFPRRIPARLLSVPRWGFLNLHPSLLPEYRGPAPLFWIFRQGESRSGVTVHFMDADLDTGDLVCQTPVDLPDGITGPQADRLLGGIGGRLLAATVRGLADGVGERRPQPRGGSFFPLPQDEDFRLMSAWPARRAYNFMRGTAEWGRTYPLTVGAEAIKLRAAVSFEPDGRLERPIEYRADQVSIQFSPGVLHALPALRI